MKRQHVLAGYTAVSLLLSGFATHQWMQVRHRSAVNTAVAAVPEVLDNEGPASSNAVAGAGAGEELSSLRETHLRSLGEISGLGYARLVTIDSFIDTVTRTSISVVQPAPRPIAWVPASLALLLLSLRFMPFSWQTKLFGQ